MSSFSGEKLDGYTHEEAAEALKRRSNVIILKVIPAWNVLFSKFNEILPSLLVRILIKNYVLNKVKRTSDYLTKKFACFSQF